MSALDDVARQFGFRNTTELAEATVELAAEAGDLARDLAESRRKLDVALLKEREARAEIKRLRKASTTEGTDEEIVQSIVDGLVRATASAVEDRRLKPERVAGKTQMSWRLT